MGLSPMSTKSNQPVKQKQETEDTEPDRYLTCTDLLCRLVCWECWQCYQIEVNQSEIKKQRAFFEKENELKGQEIALLQAQVTEMQTQLQMMQKRQQMRL
jgi:hypothetical protein